ncbi:hypothetical protein DFH07DRAFT_768862 [Mycena maculata]|uniref:Uncharacterized protein n=1 Tax=Mycena maculata TaxID=230809 RepID=A0AAD7JQ91_9AGAR|nr:hypothetical protein DFH07DRAFT_768862 [Mycena maculata]
MSDAEWHRILRLPNVCTAVLGRDLDFAFPLARAVLAKLKTKRTTLKNTLAKDFVGTRKWPFSGDRRRELKSLITNWMLQTTRRLALNRSGWNLRRVFFRIASISLAALKLCILHELKKRQTFSESRRPSELCHQGGEIGQGIQENLLQLLGENKGLHLPAPPQPDLSPLLSPALAVLGGPVLGAVAPKRGQPEWVQDNGQEEQARGEAAGQAGEEPPDIHTQAMFLQIHLTASANFDNTLFTPNNTRNALASLDLIPLPQGLPSRSRFDAIALYPTSPKSPQDVRFIIRRTQTHILIHNPYVYFAFCLSTGRVLRYPTSQVNQLSDFVEMGGRFRIGASKPPLFPPMAILHNAVLDVPPGVGQVLRTKQRLTTPASPGGRNECIGALLFGAITLLFGAIKFHGIKVGTDSVYPYGNFIELECPDWSKSGAEYFP